MTDAEKNCKKCKGTGYEVRNFGQWIRCRACEPDFVKQRRAADGRRWEQENRLSAKRNA